MRTVAKVESYGQWCAAETSCSTTDLHIVCTIVFTFVTGMLLYITRTGRDGVIARPFAHVQVEKGVEFGIDRADLHVSRQVLQVGYKPAVPDLSSARPTALD
jgi:hypothetical protein